MELRVYLRPVVVDLPESTWPITTTLMCDFSLLQFLSDDALDKFLMICEASAGAQGATYPMVAVVLCYVVVLGSTVLRRLSVGCSRCCRVDAGDAYQIGMLNDSGYEQDT